MQQGVFVDLVRTLRLPISTHVWRDGVETGAGERRELWRHEYQDSGKP
jgi:hypothetical protein